MGLNHWQYEYLVEQLHRTAYKKHECCILSALFHDPSLLELKPITQHYVKGNERYALLDLYYPQINVAVEVDEPHHAGTQAEDDYCRQQLVEKEARCTFERIRIVEGNVPEQIERLKVKLVNEINSAKANGTWQPWMEPKKLSITEAKKEFKNTLFIKIRGEIHENDLLARQTGDWRIDKRKRERITQLVVVHNGRVSAVFEKPKWINRADDKWCYRGTPIRDSALFESVITDWSTRQTITYSSDMY